MSSRANRNNRRRNTESQKNDTFFQFMDIYNFSAKSLTQRALWYSLNTESSKVVLAIGPAGVGKTLVGLHFGLLGLASKTYEKVVYVRSDVGMDFQQSLGALPGEYLEKSSHLISPVLDNLRYILPSSKSAGEYLLSKGKLEVARLDGLRGRSFSDTFVLVDEAQNMSPEQVKTCLSRIGRGSKVMLSGDASQVDHGAFRKRGNNGLVDAELRLSDLDSVDSIRFSRNDIVRSKFLKEVLERYEVKS